MAVVASEGCQDSSARPGAWSVALLLGYVVLVALLQALVSSTVEQDQAEQLVLSQRLAWNYTHQPPLYTWLVYGLGQLSSHLVAILWTLKAGLLCLLVVACDGTARELGMSLAQRRVAVAGLALLPAVIWEAQRDLTHSLLATTLLACVLWSAVAALKRPAWWRDVLTGALAGAVMLSKHNALVLLLALPVAVWLVPEMRARLRWQGVVRAMGAALLVWLPHGLWLWQHPGALDRTFQKLQEVPGQAAPAWWAVWRDMGVAMLAFLLPWGLLAVPMAWRAPLRGARPNAEQRLASRFLARLALSALACLIGWTLVLDIERFNARWFFPILFFWPMWLAAATDPARDGWGRRMVMTGLVCALCVAALMPARVIWGRSATRLNLPYDALAEGLQRQWGGKPPVLLVSNHLDGGNLKGHLGQRTQILTPIVPWTAPLQGGVFLVYRDQDLADPPTRRWLRRLTGRDVSELELGGSVTAPLRHRPETELMRLKWAVVHPVQPH